MSDNKELTAVEINGIKIPEKTINDTYQDIAHPAASEVGKLIAKPVQLVNWIADCAKNYFTGGNENTQNYKMKYRKKSKMYRQSKYVMLLKTSPSQQL